MHYESRNNTGFNIISDDNFAIAGLAGCLDNNTALDLNLHACILVITQCSLIGAFNFLRLKARLLALHELVIIIAQPSVRRITEGVGDFVRVFINVNEHPDIIAEDICQALCMNWRFDEGTPEKLTQCENRVLYLLVEGFTPSAIARMLKLNEKTISAQKRGVMRKYGVNSTVEMAMKYLLKKEAEDWPALPSADNSDHREPVAELAHPSV